MHTGILNYLYHAYPRVKPISFLHKYSYGFAFLCRIEKLNTYDGPDTLTH